jgi:hypothetical protein
MKTIPESEPLCLDYFSGGVPPGITIQGILDELAGTMDREARGLSRVNELCLIGLVAYTESFFKDQFAAILNIEPSLVQNLAKAGYDVTIDPVVLLRYEADWRNKLGFLIAEKHDLGTWKKVNGLFNAVLGISPFSKEEGKYFEALLRDRNLLVHHGGVLTTAYVAQKKAATSEEPLNGSFWNSLVITSTYLDERLEFIRALVRKTTKQACKRLTEIALTAPTPYSDEKNKAINAFEWWSEAE